MADYMTLLGAEQVSNAAGTMSNAADKMQRAASEIGYAFERHQRFLEQWLIDFRDVVESKNNAP